MSGCRACGGSTENILDLGMMALANDFKKDPVQALQAPRHPHRYDLCQKCGWIQLETTVSPECLYRDYIYRSSTSQAFKDLATGLVAQAGKPRFLVEAASNDGAMAKQFQNAGWKVLGVDPAKNLAEKAREIGVETIDDFFALPVAHQIVDKHGRADLFMARHCFGHLPDPHPFLSGIKYLLAEEGEAWIEMPYIGTMMDRNEWTAMYSEHCSWPGLRSLRTALRCHDMDLFGAQFIPMHGGSAIFKVRHGWSDFDLPPEKHYDPEAWDIFRSEMQINAARILGFLEQARRGGRFIAGYGAPAKGSVLCQYANVDRVAMPYIVDWSPEKAGLFQAGTAIPIMPPEYADENPADGYLILAWNFAAEIVEREKGKRFWVPIPRLEAV